MTRRGQWMLMVGAVVALGGVVLGILLSEPTRRPTITETRPRAETPLTIMVSFDGFPARLLTADFVPTLASLAARGVRAKGLVPVFPSSTYPNHYSIVTGLFTEHHGIVHNRMYDPEFDATFSLGDRAAVRDGRWWGGEPIWVTAQRQGRRVASLFWPGDEARLPGGQPHYWRVYNHQLDNERRVGQILAWADLPEVVRPHLILAYFSDIDDTAHRFGVNSKETRRALSQVDAVLKQLVSGLRQRERFDETNLILVSDHGMADTSSERVIVLDDYVKVDQLRVAASSPLALLWPLGQNPETLVAALANKHPHLQVFLKSQLPARLHYGHHRRIAPVVVVADEGWHVTTRKRMQADPTRFDGAAHGYDNRNPSMQGIFVARGPAFRSGVVLEPFCNVQIYELLCGLLGIGPAPNDGDAAVLRKTLR